MTAIILFLSVYLMWRNLEKYAVVDYGNKTVNRLQGLNQLVCRKWHRLGDYWLDLPEKGGLILAANHQSGMDPAVLMAITKRRVRFLATNDYYSMPGVHRILKAAGCIPVYRNKDNRLALQSAIEALNNGEIIGIFPFGGIHAPVDKEPRMRSGVCVLSKLANVPIVPIFIGGVDKFSFKKIFTSMFFKRSHLKIEQFASVDIPKDANDFNKELQHLYNLLSNHLNYNKYVDKPIEINPVRQSL